ncbi:hypothetical protein G7078_04760 [Sphingomonas sinipercae]|uniref:TraB/GumN family protein n=1 Tax=Sphingomonas sinipercae TaxID=2714944 RepID=A0A6G7ZMF4_9SPHN|nr:TraB/GumN family protein [Sphingomonas sinipercae]QIL02164.1 hypothetical protein G7078_04760 [Sphingomonas sinipercae]
MERIEKRVGMLKSSKLCAAALVVLTVPAQAQAPAAASADEIIVTAVRTGAPVWRVTSGGSTLVLVGAIDDVAAGTNWRPQALAETVSKSDRVMFPQMVSVGISPFSIVGYYAKWKRRARLPQGQSLSAMLGPADAARLQRLARSGFVPADFDRWHPLHLAFNMQDRLRKQTKLMEGPVTTVARAASKYKVPRVAIDRTSASYMLGSVFASQPAEHLPCLRATIGALEAGPDGLRKRSRDWANKQVQASLAAPASALGQSCWPSNTRLPASATLFNRAVGALHARGTTLAVLKLNALASNGGLLDRLRASGFQIEGPAWR